MNRSPDPTTPAAQPADARTRFVRPTGRTRHGFVEFQFSIGDPALYLQMILPEQAFAEFCASQRAVFLSAEQARDVDRGLARWRHGDPDTEQPA